MAVDKLVDSSQLDADLLSVANAIRAKSGGSGSLAFPAGFLSEIGNISGGGGQSGAKVIASGTVSGGGNHILSVDVGSKMPQTNFIFLAWLDDGTELSYDSNHKVASLALVMDGGLAKFDLSSTGTKTATAIKSIIVDNSGTTTTIPVRAVLGCLITIRNAGIGVSVAVPNNNMKVTRNASNFVVEWNQGNSAYKFVSGQTYNWRVLYYGSDESADVVNLEG